MPELPEVETIKRDLQSLIVGKTIVDINGDTPKQVQPSLKLVKKAVVGKKIKTVERRAKNLQIILENNQALLVHLKLTGRLLYRHHSDPPDKWVHVTLFFKDGHELRFSDSRKFGWFKLAGKEDLKQLGREFGPEPLHGLGLKEFEEILASTSRAVKILLMDQKRIAGVGNIYACDALFLARIDPRRPANDLSEKEAERLLEALEKVLRAGIKYRGASDQYYLDALGKKGSYQDHFLVYGRKGEPCFDCSGKVERMVVGGRGTFFCPKCQK